MRVTFGRMGHILLAEGNLLNHWRNLKRSCPNPEWRRDLARAYIRLRIANGTAADLARCVKALPLAGNPREEWIPAWKARDLVPLDKSDG